MTKQINDLEKTVMGEITSLQDELQKEETRRTTEDKQLLQQVNQFLTSLQPPKQQQPVAVK